MQIAMSAPHQQSVAAASQKREQGRESVPALGDQMRGLFRREQVRKLCECLFVLIDVILKRIDPRIGLHRKRRTVRGGNRTGELVSDPLIDLAGVGEMIERRAFVEALHLQRPFHRLAVAIEGQMAGYIPGDRPYAAIDLRREHAVDPQFRLASRLAFVQCRVIEKWKAYRAFHFQGAVSGKEYSRAMGVDAGDAGAAMCRRIGQECEDGLLRLHRMGFGHDRCANLSERGA
jgi:hypothetical protein